MFVLSCGDATVNGNDAAGHKAVGRRGHAANRMRDFLSAADAAQRLRRCHVRQGVAAVGVYQLAGKKRRVHIRRADAVDANRWR